jgi:hypothetical protein
MPRWSSQQGADPSSRRGDLTLRKSHYQTGPARPVNHRKYQLLPLFSRNKTFESEGPDRTPKMDLRKAVPRCLCHEPRYPATGSRPGEPDDKLRRGIRFSRMVTSDGGNVIDLTLNAPMRTGQWI